ncbi:type I restriction enzyme methylase [Caudoviricetes sp.]|nr:type I restriction enzyme methylase [Caudoviricetes sp.]
MSKGLEQLNLLKDAGYTDTELSDWESNTRRHLFDGGFSTREIGDYFGEKEFNKEPVRSYFEKNFAVQDSETAPSETKSTTPPKPPKQITEADSILEAFQAGWQISIEGLDFRGRNPDVILPQDAPMYYNIASGISNLAGDAPSMLVGAMAGAAAGTAIAPGPGTVVGGGAGAFALPMALRKMYMDSHEKGEVKDFKDFWGRASSVFLEGGKGAVIGGLTAGAGGVVTKALGKATAPGLSSLVRRIAPTSAEVATMVTIGSAIEGHVPKPEDFLEAAILVAGFHGTVAVGNRLRNIYVRTGVKPSEVALKAEQDPYLKQQLLGDGEAIPAEFKHLDETPPHKDTNTIQLTIKNDNLNIFEGENLPTEIKIETPSPKSSGGEPPTRPPFVQDMLDRMGKPPETPGLVGQIKSITYDDFYRNVVDDLDPIRNFEKAMTNGGTIDIKDSPYKLARLGRGDFGKADHFLEISPYRFDNLQNVGKSFKTIVKPIKDVEAFKAYLLAKHSLEATTKTGVDLESAQKMVEYGRDKYDAAAKDLAEYQDHLLQYLVDGGIVAKDKAKKYREVYKAYIPLYRLFDGPDVGPGAPKGIQTKDPIKGRKGSERIIHDPLESIIKNTYLHIRVTERNFVLNKMIELSKTSGLGEGWIKEIKTPMRPIGLESKEIAKFLGEEAGALEQYVKDNDIDLTIFRPQSLRLKENEVVVYNHGVRKIYELEPNLAKAVKALDRESIGLVLKVLAIPARSLRAGATIVPDFMLRNLFRDQFSAFIQTKNFIPIYDTLRGLGGLLAKDADYQMWLKAGGANSALLSMDIDYIRKEIFKVSKETGLLKNAINVVTGSWEMLRVMSEISENATRLGMYKRASGGNTNKALDGAFTSREGTLDFARIGAKARAWNMITAFANAHVQGLDRIGRAFHDDWKGTSAKVVASITIPSLLLWWANQDDPRWEGLPRWQKDLFWIVFTDNWEESDKKTAQGRLKGMYKFENDKWYVNNGHTYRFPKPFEIGLIFGSLPERAFEQFFTDHPNAFKDFEETLAKAFTPSVIPTFAVGVVEQWAKKSTFTGQNIIPSYLEGQFSDLQYTNYTTESAKAISKLLVMLPGLKDRDQEWTSPMMLENYIRSWSGNLGVYALQIADQALDAAGVVDVSPKATKDFSEWPVVKAFMIRNPSLSDQSIQDFYDRYEKNQRTIKSIDSLGKSGQFDKYREEIMNPENQMNMVKLNSIKDGLSKQNKLLRLININPENSADDKRMLSDRLIYGMIKMAQEGNRVLRIMDEKFKEKLENNP